LRNRATSEFLYGAGLRVSELIHLKLTDVYQDIGFIKVVGKGDKERLVPAGRDAFHSFKRLFGNTFAQIPVKKAAMNAGIFKSPGQRPQPRDGIFNLQGFSRQCGNQQNN
jgi:site-specific recombinase XerD